MLKKSVRNGLIAFVLLWLFSMTYGYLGTEVPEIGFTLENTLLAILGATWLAVVYAFIPVFCLSLGFYYLKEKFQNKRGLKNPLT